MIALGVVLAASVVGSDAQVQAAVDRSGVDAALVIEVATGRVIAQAGAVERPRPPGSTFKLVSTIAAARDLPAALDLVQRCDGRATIGGASVRCYDRHGPVRFDDAVATSCNVWWGALGQRVGSPSLLRAARSLGVGAAPGRLPPSTTKPALLADGFGVQVTARQQAAVARAIATGHTDDGRPLADPALVARLRSGMRAAVERGTAKGAAASKVSLAAKTGTAEVGGRAVGWLVAYAPADSPTVVLVLQRDGEMGKDLASRAPAILDAAFAP